MIDPRSFRDVARAIEIGYPIPFLVSVLVAFAYLCFRLAVAGQGWVSAAIAVIGLVAGGSGIGLAIFAVLFRPGLLRSERHVLTEQAMEFFGNDEIPNEDRAVIASSVRKVVGEPARRPRLERDEDSE